MVWSRGTCETVAWVARVLEKACHGMVYLEDALRGMGWSGEGVLSGGTREWAHDRDFLVQDDKDEIIHIVTDNFSVIMDVMNVEQAKIAEEAGACAVMALGELKDSCRGPLLLLQGNLIKGVQASWPPTL